AMEIAGYCDVVLYLVRQSITKKSMLSIVNEKHKKGELPNLSLLLNGFESKAKYGYGYAEYKYSAYGYYEDEVRPRTIRERLDNFATGHKYNIEHLFENPNFELIEGDIRNLEDCQKAVQGATYVLHQAALGSVPRSIKDPITSNETNVSGFLNMLVASRDAGVKRFIYAASSSTYGDSESLPKAEDKIGNPLSPYASTKYVNELY